MESSPSPSKVFSGYSDNKASYSSVGLGYIEHAVTKFDTLAGVAIKYGVEVADVKRMNGLTTDLQMFSRKTLHIPLPGRHPPSPIMSNGHETHVPRRLSTTPPNHRHSDLLDSIKSLKLSSSSPRTVSPSMEALRDYHGLKPTNQNGINERFENGPKQSEPSNPAHGLHRKCKSLACELSETGSTDNETTPATNGKKSDSDSWYDILTRRRKSEIDLQNHTLQTMLKPDTTITTNTATAFSPAAGKGLALRPKAASRTTSDADGPQNMPPLKLGDSVITDAFSGVKKSSSSPSFQESLTGNNNTNGTSTSSIWPTSMLNLTVDLQALSTAAITRPMFDGLPKPMSGRKSKAAMD
ncbi:uncharacterized protein LOC143578166 [Bidens hawaiensis]|uniref:uncharacterized protein LOC143578166 n=1 Tax=Bidens hawaiensis TaxID=980011 RepID=UPI004049DF00